MSRLRDSGHGYDWLAARGDLSADGLHRKLAWVVSKLNTRLRTIKAEHQCQPPLTELEVEMDCRRVTSETVLDRAVS